MAADSPGPASFPPHTFSSRLSRDRASGTAAPAEVGRGRPLWRVTLSGAPGGYQLGQDPRQLGRLGEREAGLLRLGRAGGGRGGLGGGERLGGGPGGGPPRSPR